LDFGFSVNDVIIEVGLRIFGRGQRALGANPTNHFSDSSFIGHKAITRVFRALDWHYSVSGSKIMAQKPKIL